MADALDSLRLMRTQERPEQVFVRGQGSWLWDSDGRAFLDFTQGLAVNCLGHSPSVLVQALARQARELVSAGPGLLNRPVLALAQRLCLATGSDQAYFLTSGAEANEAAIALARKWGRLHRGGAQRIVSTVNSIHGRTPGTLTACGKPAQHGLEGFARVPFNDLDAMAAAIDEETVAVMLEPVQGDAGVIPATLDYLRGIERLCRQRGVLLILDEVQTGIGRCGALLARGNACCFEPGDQLGTHHGNALMTAAGLAVLNTVLEPGFLEQVREQGTHLRDGLARVARRYGHGPLRGQGLFWGLPLIGQRAPAVVRAAFGEGLLINAPQPHCLRFSPALTVSRANVDEMLRRLERALARVANRHEEVA
ncbi:TPA: aspartate aminotransferase family protein [Pseudomonas aeruginosa]|nr:aspartate aminotransferase family protein [Pseudomonas aeruginosa]